MSTVGEQLRAARESANLTVEQVADRTKMRTDHVRALEDGQYGAFSAPVYIRGFIRTYSTMLKLDTKGLLRQLDTELGRDHPSYDDSARHSHSQGIVDFITLQFSKLDWRKSLVGLIAAAVIIGGLGGLLAWRKGRSEDPLKDLKPAIYKPAGGTSETLPLPR